MTNSKPTSNLLWWLATVTHSMKVNKQINNQHVLLTALYHLGQIQGTLQNKPQIL